MNQSIWRISWGGARSPPRGEESPPKKSSTDRTTICLWYSDRQCMTLPWWLDQPGSVHITLWNYNATPIIQTSRFTKISSGQLKWIPCARVPCGWQAAISAALWRLIRSLWHRSLRHRLLAIKPSFKHKLGICHRRYSGGRQVARFAAIHRSIETWFEYQHIRVSTDI